MVNRHTASRYVVNCVGRRFSSYIEKEKEALHPREYDVIFARRPRRYGTTVGMEALFALPGHIDCVAEHRRTVIIAQDDAEPVPAPDINRQGGGLNVV